MDNHIAELLGKHDITASVIGGQDNYRIYRLTYVNMP